MTDKSTDTLKQIMKKPIKTVWSIDDNGYKKEYLSFESANEILAIAIKSPEAEKHWRHQIGRELLERGIIVSEDREVIREVCQMEAQS